MLESTGRVIDLPEESEELTFEEIYEKYAGRILNLAFRLTGNEETARDLTQDIFIKVYMNLDSFERRSSIYTWIYRISMNHISNYLKRERRFVWVDLMDRSVSELFRVRRGGAATHEKTGDTGPGHSMEKVEREKIVLSAVQSLPGKYRIPLVLHLYEGMSYKEIAAAMKLSMSAIESRIHRAKKRLIKKLEPWLEHI